MNLISSDKFYDEHWIAYAKLLNEINRKHYQEEAEKEIQWESFKRKVLNETEILKADHAKQFLVIDHGKAAGWYAQRLIGGEVNFCFDVPDDMVTDEFIKTIFDNLYEFLHFAGKENAHTDTSEKRISNSLIRHGAEETDKMIFSRICRNEIDILNLNSIMESVSSKLNLRLEFFDNVSDEIFDRYYEVYNEARVSMNEFNPHRKEVVKRSKENLRTKLRFDTGPEDKMFMYMLFDGDEIAAFSSLYVRKERPKVIDHGGGLTAVSGKYRGNNFAKFLKAKLYVKILNEYPDFEYIMTDTYPWNKYMYRINESMGFKPFKEFTEFRISKDKLNKKMK